MTLLEAARYPADTVRLKAEEYEGYQKRFPEMVAKKIPLSIDEYAYFNFTPGSGGGPFGGMNLKQALSYGMILNEMMRYTDFITMGAQTTGVSLINFNRTASTMNGLGLLYKMYGDHFVGAIPVALTGNSPQPAPEVSSRQSRSAGEQPSGSPTYPLDMFAALSADHKVPDRLRCECDGVRTEVRSERDGRACGRAIDTVAVDGQAARRCERCGQRRNSRSMKSSIGNAPATITVAPISVNLYQFPLAGAGQ